MNYNFWFGGYSDPLSSIANAPVADHPAVNEVQQTLYRTNLPDAVLDGHYEWLGEGFCGGGLDFEFTRHVYPMPGCSEVHMFWRYGGSFMGTMLDTNKWVKMYKSPKLEFVVNQDIHLNPEGRMADVILPACTNLERVDIGEVGNSGNGGYCSHSQTGNSWQVIVYQDKAIEPLWDSRSDFWIFFQVAARLGWGEEFTEGRDEEGWVKALLPVLRPAQAHELGGLQAEGLLHPPGVLQGREQGPQDRPVSRSGTNTPASSGSPRSAPATPPTTRSSRRRASWAPCPVSSSSCPSPAVLGTR